MPESVFIEKSVGSLLVPSAAGFSPSVDQPGITVDTDLQMMVQVFQDDSDWTVTNNTTLTANRTGRYRLSAMWMFTRGAGAVEDFFNVDVILSGTLVKRRGVFCSASAGGSDEISACMVVAQSIVAGNTLQLRISNITATNTYEFVALRSSLLIERMR